MKKRISLLVLFIIILASSPKINDKNITQIPDNILKNSTSLDIIGFPYFFEDTSSSVMHYRVVDLKSVCL